MDYLGLSMLIFPMSKDYTGVEDNARHKCDATVPEMATRIGEMAELARKASGRFRKPIIFTELHGWAHDGAAYQKSDEGGKLHISEKEFDFQEQADIVEAKMRVLTGLECCHGVGWNVWAMPELGLDYPPNPDELKFNLYNLRPAEKVLR